ncbi:MAG TPA: hypothetical protein VGO67_08490 [Verrucomicrobiae bacterium]
MQILANAGNVSIERTALRKSKLRLSSALTESRMKVIGLPTENEMLRLKAELNFLLWTNDPPMVPSHIASSLPGMEQSKVNIQCAAHTVVVIGLLMRRGFGVTSHRGQAFVVEISPDGNQENDRLEQILRHFWLTLDKYGLMDLSLRGEQEHPMIYCNRSVGGRWQVGFGDEEKVARYINSRRQGCYYRASNQQVVTEASLAQALHEEFPPARFKGINLPYKNFVDHCEKLIADPSVSILSLLQDAAWRKLASQSG